MEADRILAIYNAVPPVFTAVVLGTVAAVMGVRWCHNRRFLLLLRVAGWSAFALLYVCLQWQPAWWGLYGRALFRLAITAVGTFELAAAVDGLRADRLRDVLLKDSQNG